MLASKLNCCLTNTIAKVDKILESLGCCLRPARALQVNLGSQQNVPDELYVPAACEASCHVTGKPSKGKGARTDLGHSNERLHCA